MRVWAIASLCILGLSCPLAAQFRAAGQDRYPYEGVVTGTGVYVRSAPGVESVPCAKVSRSDKVTVVAAEDGWLKIEPVQGCFSVIDKDKVSRSVTGAFGTVTAQRAFVRAGGELSQKRYPVIQRILRRGDEVRVRGQAGDYFVIQPPKGAYFFISAEYVARAGTVEAPAPETQVPPSAEQTVTATEPPEELKKVKRQWDQAEEALQAEYQTPFEQRDYQKLIEQYRQIEAPEDHHLQPFIEARIAFLEGEIERRKELQDLESYIEEATARQQRLKELRAKIEMGPGPTTKPAVEYAAKGVLTPSELFPGGAAAPKRYILRDPDSGRITAYVQCTTGLVDLGDHAGSYVGIFGTKEFNEELMLDLVEARQVRVLSEDVEAPSPPQPSVRFPSPAPTTRPAERVEPEPSEGPGPEPGEGPGPAPAERQPEPGSIETRPAVRPDFGEEPATEPLPETGLPTVEPSTEPAEESVDSSQYE